MKQINECKIVQDLLPNYIDNLTNEESNKFIEEHIKDCEDCKKKLNRMAKNINVNNPAQEKEIKYLKKIKRKTSLTILLVIIGLLAIFVGVFKFISTYKFTTDENGKVKVVNMVANYKVSNSTHLIFKGKKSIAEGTKDGYLYVSIIATIDENGKCTNVRHIHDGYSNEETLNDTYNSMSTKEAIMYTNPKIIDNKLHFNSNVLNGSTKDEVIEIIMDTYDIEITEEL